MKLHIQSQRLWLPTSFLIYAPLQRVSYSGSWGINMSNRQYVLQQLDKREFDWLIIVLVGPLP